MAAGGIGAIGLGASLAGGILSAFGSYQTGKNQQAMYNYQAQVARINAQIDRQNADWSYHKGDIEAQQYGMKAAQQRGAIRAAQGASNIDVNSGSAVEVQRSQEKLKNIDLGQIRENAAKTAYDWQVKAVMDENQAGLYQYAGENAMQAGKIGAFSSILGSVGSVSSKWLQGNQVGLWS